MVGQCLELYVEGSWCTALVSVVGLRSAHLVVLSVDHLLLLGAQSFVLSEFVGTGSDVDVISYHETRIFYFGFRRL